MGKLTLSPMQVRFVECYTGNATQAAIDAGYSPKSASATGSNLLKRPEIIEAIQEIENVRTLARIATRDDRMEFWTNVMLDEEQKMTDRLRASELLGKANGDFLERVERKLPDGIKITVETVDYSKTKTTVPVRINA